MTIGSFILWMIAIAFAIAWLKPMDRRFPLVTRVVWTLLVGFTAGFLARFLIPGAVIPSFGTTALLGIAGAAVGGLIGSRLAGSRDRRLGRAGAITAVIGSVLLLWVSFGLARSQGLPRLPGRAAAGPCSLIDVLGSPCLAGTPIVAASVNENGEKPWAS